MGKRSAGEKRAMEVGMVEQRGEGNAKEKGQLVMDGVAT